MNIDNILPHRKPFLFVDEIVEVQYMKYSKGIKYVNVNEFWVEGHFPGNPIFPGVLLLETMAQVGGLVFVDSTGNMPEKKFAYLSKVDRFKILQKVIPGDEIIVEAVFVDSFMQFAKVKAKANVNGKKLAEAEITYTFLDNL
ncbi:3-hydroxyacyl-ACP dehydratase FabZ [Lachnotalea glycerini]|uniref:3-hydroxyacyl-[acyl-carrier-protein] dehydratase n=1 Tax=Lachnotalea glycerini TaxID=1763509 RepID=A0A371JGR7_9FIRM|nr:3-hydroxyacyl-ACP dehydratase FabZ [Lachnotalea glycerini]RDY31934.1 beta-hydroxyacyl-ACP dehydratase [Lachnotalea glycerini]